MPLDQVEIESSNSFLRRFRLELGNFDPSLDLFAVYTPPKDWPYNITCSPVLNTRVLCLPGTRDREITDTKTGNLILRSLYVTSNQNFRNLVNWNRASVGISNQLLYGPGILTVYCKLWLSTTRKWL
jgi:hypothetical protein